MTPIEMTPIADESKYESLLQSLFIDLSDNLRESEVNSDEEIQRVVQRLIAQFREGLDSYPKAKKDFMEPGPRLERWGGMVLDPLTNVAENYFKEILIAHNKQQEDALLREELTKQNNALRDERERLLLYIDQQRSLALETKDSNPIDPYLDDL